MSVIPDHWWAILNTVGSCYWSNSCMSVWPPLFRNVSPVNIFHFDVVFFCCCCSWCSVKHCLKSVCIRSYSDPHSPAFRLNMERYSVSLRIRSNCGKMQTRITLNRDTFYEVKLTHFWPVLPFYTPWKQQCFQVL